MGSREPYKVVRCPSCGWLQVVRARKATICRRCGKAINLEAIGPLALASSPKEARELLVAIKEFERRRRKA